MLAQSLTVAVFVWGFIGFVLLVVYAIGRKRSDRARAAVQDIHAAPPAEPAGAGHGALAGVCCACAAFLAFTPVAAAKRWHVDELFFISLFTLAAIVFVGIVVGGWASRRSLWTAVATCAGAGFLAGLYWISNEFRDKNPDGMEKAFRDLFVVVFAMPSSVGCGALFWWLVFTTRAAKQ